jgi:transcription factor TFIIIB component B''
MQTLSRMTGKDFSGPTPEIHAPAVLSLAEPDKSRDDQPTESTRKKSTTPGFAGDGAEVLGDAASYNKDDDA